MRLLLVLAGLAALAAARVAAQPVLGLDAEPGPSLAGAGHVPVPVLFTFAVSAFRERLR